MLLGTHQNCSLPRPGNSNVYQQLLSGKEKERKKKVFSYAQYCFLSRATGNNISATEKPDNDRGRDRHLS